MKAQAKHVKVTQISMEQEEIIDTFGTYQHPQA